MNLKILTASSFAVLGLLLQMNDASAMRSMRQQILDANQALASNSTQAVTELAEFKTLGVHQK